MASVTLEKNKQVRKRQLESLLATSHCSKLCSESGEQYRNKRYKDALMKCLCDASALQRTRKSFLKLTKVCSPDVG